MTLGYDIKSGEITDSSGVVYNINTGEISVIIDGNVSNGGGGGSSEWGLTDRDILGQIDELGNFGYPTSPFSLEIPGAIKISSDRFWYFKFYANKGITSIKFPDLEETTNVGEIFANCFYLCSNLISAEFPKLKTIGGYSTFYFAFRKCSLLKTVDFSSLQTISGAGNFQGVFQDCPSLERISFPSLKTIGNNSTFGGSSFDYAFANCPALTEIHFRADMQSKVESLNGYAVKWGATNATIYFDL